MGKRLTDLPTQTAAGTDYVVGVRTAGIKMTVQSIVDLAAAGAGVQDYILLRNATTGTTWKLELVGATDDTTEPKWTPQ